MQPIILPQPIHDEIVAHARQGKPEEVCGILRGRGQEALELIRGHNVAPDPVNDYVLDPQTLLLQFRFEEAGDEMVAIYHSHPVSVAFPSASDAWNAHYPDSIYLICSLEFDARPVLRAFRLLPHFPDLELATLRETLGFYVTRPQLFGYFQEQDQPIPAALQRMAGGIATPFYIVFQLKAPSGEVDEHRVVTVEEVPIQTISKL